jgi:hypothetical protein
LPIVDFDLSPVSIAAGTAINAARSGDRLLIVDPISLLVLKGIFGAPANTVIPSAFVYGDLSLVNAATFTSLNVTADSILTTSAFTASALTVDPAAKLTTRVNSFISGTFSGGSLIVNLATATVGPATLQTGSITVQSTLSFSGTVNGNAALSIVNSGSVQCSPSAVVTLQGSVENQGVWNADCRVVIQGSFNGTVSSTAAGSFVWDSAGTLTAQEANFLGTLEIAQGQVDASSALTGTVAFAGGALNVLSNLSLPALVVKSGTSSLTGSSSVQLTATDLDVQGGALSIGGVSGLSVLGTTTFASSGTAQLTLASTFSTSNLQATSGQTTVTGNVQATNATIGASTTMTLNSNILNLLSGNLAGSYVAQSSLLASGGSLQGTLSVAAGAAGSISALSIAAGGVLNNNATLTLTGTLSNSGTLNNYATVNAATSITLANVRTYAGSTTSGSISFNGNNVFAAGSSVTGTLSFVGGTSTVSSGFDATINGGAVTVSLAANSSGPVFALQAGSLATANSLRLSGLLWSGGSIGSGTFFLTGWSSSGTLNVQSSTNLYFANGSLTGTIAAASGAVLTCAAGSSLVFSAFTFTAAGSATFQNDGAISVSSASAVQNLALAAGASVTLDAGLSLNGGSSVGTFNVNAGVTLTASSFNMDGVIQGNGSLVIAPGCNASSTLNCNVALITVQGASTFSDTTFTGQTIVASSAVLLGSLTLDECSASGALTFGTAARYNSLSLNSATVTGCVSLSPVSNASTLFISGGSFDDCTFVSPVNVSGTVQFTALTTVNGGAVALNGATVSSPIISIGQNSALEGSGTITSASSITGVGSVNIGGVGTLGTMTTSSLAITGRLRFDIASDTQYDRLIINGALNSACVLEFNFVGGYNPPAGVSFALITFQSLGSNFTQVVNPLGIGAVLTYTATSVSLSRALCSQLNECYGCGLDPGCSWCDTDNICVDSTNRTCAALFDNATQCFDCATESACDACLTQYSCNWCPDEATCVAKYFSSECSSVLSDASLCESTPVGLIAGLVVGLLLLLVLVIVASVLVVRRKKNSLKLPPPPPMPEGADLEQFMFGAAVFAKRKEKSKMATLEQFHRLLASNVAFAQHLCRAATAAELDDITLAVVLAQEASGTKAATVIGHFIETEVEEADGAGTLFRSNSAATKLLKAYTKLHGIPYLFQTIGGVLTELIHNIGDTDLEVDPRRMEDDSDADVNRYQLMMTAQKILSSVLKSLPIVPLQFRVVSKLLQDSVSVKFPENKHSCIGGFIFLRFLNPAILSPESYGLVSSQPNEAVRRVLVLVTKALQNLANGIEFGDKEAHMAQLNDFISSNQGKINKFFDDVASVDESAVQEVPGADIPTYALSAALDILHRFVHVNRARLQQQMEAEPDLFGQLDNVLADIGPPTGNTVRDSFGSDRE